jgi:hypothetical protein
VLSRTDARRRGAVLFMAAGLWLGCAHAADPPAPPSRADIEAATARVAKDPNLATKEKSRTLQFRKSDKPEDKKPDEKAQPWLDGLFKWMSETGRLLVYALGIVLVALLLVGLHRFIRARGDALLPRRANLPSHVQSLDIRPESLPADIGAAAAELWTLGEHRQSLSLLYRGALSRLVHGHAVPIRSASTEGECVTMARDRLSAPAGGFFARLVAAWQLAVYGARLPGDEAVLALCREFDAHLPATRQGSAA